MLAATRMLACAVLVIGVAVGASTAAPATADPPPITFAERQLLRPVGPRIQAGELDGSPYPEIAGITDGRIMVLRNLDAHQFSIPQRIDMSIGSVTDFALGDLDRDGRLDLVAMSATPPAIIVRMNLGAFTFAPPASYPLPSEPLKLAVGDLNGDLREDVVVVCETELASFLAMSNGTLAALTPEPIAPFQYGRGFIRDMDGDGKQDFVHLVYWESMMTVDWLRGRGNGLFEAARTIARPTNGEFITVADVDRDGDEDLLWANYYNVYCHLNDGAGEFTSVVSVPTPAVGNNLTQIDTGDVDGNGTVDIVVTGDFIGSADNNYLVSVVYSPLDEERRHMDSWHVPGDPTGLVLADFDGDAALDVAVSCTSGNDTNWEGGYWRGPSTAMLWNDGRGQLVGKLSMTLPDFSWSGPGAIRLLAARSMPSVVPDLIVAINNTAQLMRNRGRGTFDAPIVIAHGLPRAVADLTGDGADDLVVTRADSIHVYRRTPAQPAFALATSIKTPLSLLGVADFDGDGAQDLALKDPLQRVWMMPGDGLGTFAEPVDLGATLPEDYKSVWLGDVSGDGRSDLAVGAPIYEQDWSSDEDYARAELRVLLNDGKGLVERDSPDTLVLKLDYCCAYASRIVIDDGDLDGDGDLDLLVEMHDFGSFSALGTLINDGAGQLSVVRPARRVGSPGGLMVSADFNRDGLCDALLHDSDGLDFDFYPLTGIGDGQFSGTEYLVGAHSASDMVAADFDGDGQIDAALLGHFGELEVFRNTTVAGSGPPSNQASLVSARCVDETIELEWRVPEGQSIRGELERSTNTTVWSSVGTLSPDANGRVQFQDADVARGTRYGYRLRYRLRGYDLVSAETWVDFPILSLAIGAPIPSPAQGVPNFAVTLPQQQDAIFEILDIAGRRVREQRLSGLAAGTHRITISGGALVPGLYFARLRAGNETVGRRFVAIR